MSIIELKTGTSFDLALFKEFAKFIIVQENGQNKKINLYEWFKTLFKIEKGDRTLQMDFTRAKKKGTYKLSENQYKIFCDRFNETYENLPSKDDYRDIKLAFNQWKSNIDSKNNITENKIADIGPDAQDIVPKTSNISYDPITDNYNQFNKQLSLFNNYYSENVGYEKRIGANFTGLEIEAKLFKVWQTWVNDRVDYNINKPHGFSIQISRIRRLIEFSNWELYEVGDNNVIKKSVLITDKPFSHTSQSKEGKSLVSYARLIKDSQPATVNELIKFQYSFHPKLYTFSYTEDTEVSDYLICYSFDAVGGFQTGLQIGHRIAYNKRNKNIDIRISVLRPIEKSNDTPPTYSEFPFESHDVPILIKSILLFPNSNILKVAPYSKLLHSLVIHEIQKP